MKRMEQGMLQPLPQNQKTKIKYMEFLIAFLVAIAAFVIDWQKDKSSIKDNAVKNWIKYAAMIVVGGLYFGLFQKLAIARYINAGLVAAGVYFLWTFIVNLFKKK